MAQQTDLERVRPLYTKAHLAQRGIVKPPAQPLAEIEWCEAACVPKDKCVACKQGDHHA